MAIAAAHTAGIPADTIRQAVGNFPGLPHRLQPIRTLQGVQFINDSKATNYDAALVGLASVSGPTILIAGGQPKAGDDSAWLRAICNQVGYTILVGEAAPQFAARLNDVQYTGYDIVDGLELAVPLAFQRARQWLTGMTDRSSGVAPSPQTRSTETSGTTAIESVTVLFSPACASFDAYRNFEHRGEHFQKCCEQLAS